MNLLRRTSKENKRNSDFLDPEDIFLDASNSPGFDENKLEGTFEKPLAHSLSRVFLFLLIIIFSLFGSRLYMMQVVKGDSYKERANKNAIKKIPVFPLRGTIEDRNGEPLAWNLKNEVSGVLERRYIKVPGFSNVLGYVSYPKKDQSGIFWQDAYLGKDGVEKQFQGLLQGQNGEQIIEVSATREIVSNNVLTTATPGKNIKLSIDAKVQAKMYSEIEKLAKQASFESGAGVIIDARNGEVISLVNYPEYDNNLMTNASSAEEKATISSDLVSTHNKFLNRPISGLFIPGSTVKPFMALAALEEKVISPYKNIFSSGQLVVKNKYGGPDSIFKDWKAHGYVDMRKAISVSSDEYFYQVGGGFADQPGLGIKRIYSYMDKFGFEDITGIDLPGEVSGVVPSEEWKKRKFKDGDWKLGNTYHTSIGQFGFQTTPIELARSYALIANGHNLVTPTILLDKKASSTPVDFSDENLRVVREGMRLSAIEGTAHLLTMENVSLAGKTGTAEVGTNKEKVNSLVAAYFPYENPKYVIVIVMEKAARGNTFGATLAGKEMMTFLRDETNYTK